MFRQGETVYFQDFEHLLFTANELTPSFTYVGDGFFVAIVAMPDVGKEAVLADCGLTMYRGPGIGSSETVRYAYTFHPDAMRPDTVRKVTWMYWFHWLLGLFGRGPQRPPPWIDEHPIYQIRPQLADILVQTFPRWPQWNRVKPLTE